MGVRGQLRGNVSMWSCDQGCAAGVCALTCVWMIGHLISPSKKLLQYRSPDGLKRQVVRLSGVVHVSPRQHRPSPGRPARHPGTRGRPYPAESRSDLEAPLPGHRYLPRCRQTFPRSKSKADELPLGHQRAAPPTELRLSNRNDTEPECPGLVSARLPTPAWVDGLALFRLSLHGGSRPLPPLPPPPLLPIPPSPLPPFPALMFPLSCSPVAEG